MNNNPFFPTNDKRLRMWWFLIPLSRAMNVHVCGAWRCLGRKNTIVWREMCVWPEKGTRWWFPTAFCIFTPKCGKWFNLTRIWQTHQPVKFLLEEFCFPSSVFKMDIWQTQQLVKSCSCPKNSGGTMHTNFPPKSNLTATKASKTYKRDGSGKNTVVAPVKVVFRYHFQASIFKWKVWWICLISKAVSFFVVRMMGNLPPNNSWENGMKLSTYFAGSQNIRRCFKMIWVAELEFLTSNLITLGLVSYLKTSAFFGP